jgi:hypothetical protein
MHMKQVHLNPHKESRKVAPLWPGLEHIQLLNVCSVFLRRCYWLCFACFVLSHLAPVREHRASAERISRQPSICSVSFSYCSDPAYRLQLESSTFSWTNLLVSRAWVGKPAPKPCPPATDRTVTTTTSAKGRVFQRLEVGWSLYHVGNDFAGSNLIYLVLSFYE